MSSSTRSIIVLSYGAGVQTRAMLRLVASGDLPRPDLITFGDTGQEPKKVYTALQEDRAFAAEHDLDFVVCRWGDLAAPPYGVHVPLFTLNADGKKGQLFRTCTERFKIRPIRQELRRRGVTQATMWLGITRDEIERAKPSPLKWITHEFPLLGLGLNRTQCEAILAGVGLEAVKSACVFCPYRSKELWESVRGADLDRAIAYDESIRHVRPGYTSYVHVSRTPLIDAIVLPGLSNAQQDECTGHCFL